MKHAQWGYSCILSSWRIVNLHFNQKWAGNSSCQIKGASLHQLREQLCGLSCCSWLKLRLLCHNTVMLFYTDSHHPLFSNASIYQKLYCKQKINISSAILAECTLGGVYHPLPRAGGIRVLLLCRFAFKSPILLAHHIVTGRGQQLFPIQDEGRERNSLKNQTCCHGNQNKDFGGQTGCIYISEMKKSLPIYSNTFSGKCL